MNKKEMIEIVDEIIDLFDKEIINTVGNQTIQKEHLRVIFQGLKTSFYKKIALTIDDETNGQD